MVVVFNKTDLAAAAGSRSNRLAELQDRPVLTAASEGRGILDFRQALLDAAPADFIDNPTILGDLVGAGELAVLVVPIDKEAPRGRLILPQVQAIRDLLDSDAMALVVKERELRSALERLNQPAQARGHRLAGVSQGGRRHAARRAHDQLLASCSRASRAISSARSRARWPSSDLKSGARVLIAEACSHHPIGEDIGRVKIPRWLTQYVGGKLEFEHVQGHDFPDDPSRLRPGRSTAAPARSTGARCSAACCAAARPACRSPTTAS